MADPNNVPLDQYLRHLRMQGQFEQARAVITKAAQTLPAFAPSARQLLQAHDDIWWAQPTGRRCRLRRRGPGDAAFIRQLWADRHFVQHFNPGAAPLPADDTGLQRVLAHEFTALAGQSRTLHWTIETLTGHVFGVLSLVDLSFQHRRAELLIGVQLPPYIGAAAEATLLAIDCAFDVFKLNKLTALVPAYNTASLASSAHMGFVHEGVLRQHLMDPRSQQPIDLVNMALLRTDVAAAQAQQRVRRKLLGPGLKARFVRHVVTPKQAST